jgi:hypothetical protein
MIVCGSQLRATLFVWQGQLGPLLTAPCPMLPADRKRTNATSCICLCVMACKHFPYALIGASLQCDNAHFVEYCLLGRASLSEFRLEAVPS